MTEKQSCEIPDSNPPGNEIKEILENSKTIAVVGLSDNPERDSYRVGKYMKDHGYTVIPVNPVKTEILGEKSYPDLSSIPSRVDIVDIFRNIEAIPGIVEEAIKIRAKVVWMQLSLAHNESKCLKIEHAKL
jgi:predicted CoA-binding protein